MPARRTGGDECALAAESLQSFSGLDSGSSVRVGPGMVGVPFSVARAAMRTILTILGALLMFSGAVWLLQGLGVLPGSFMTGQLRWAVYGGATILAGVIVVTFGRGRSRGEE